MARRSKRRVKNRAKTHRVRVRAGHTMRKRRAARGLRPVAKKRQRRAARRAHKANVAR